MGIASSQSNPAARTDSAALSVARDAAGGVSFEERRAFPRHPVDCPATVTPISGSGTIVARMLDLSLGGCRLSTTERVSLGMLARVEISFQVRGLAFRIVGVITRTRTGSSFAVRFLDLPHRRASELAEAIRELATQELATQESATPPPPDRGPTLMREQPVAAPSASTPPITAQASPAEHPLTPTLPSQNQLPAIKSPTNYRRSHSRHPVDTRVNLTLVKSAICMPGCIVDLSQGGCRLRTDERINFGIYTRVEAEFFVQGLPFRLAGVSQAIIDSNTIGIRFLDMSERKREQLTELIAEIAAAQPDLTDAAHFPDAAADASSDPTAL